MKRKGVLLYFLLFLFYFLLLALYHVLAPVFQALAAVRFQVLPRLIFDMLSLTAALFLLCGRSYLNARLPRTGGVLLGQGACLAAAVLTVALLWLSVGSNLVSRGLLLAAGCLFDLCAALCARLRGRGARPQ